MYSKTISQQNMLSDIIIYWTKVRNFSPSNSKHLQKRNTRGAEDRKIGETGETGRPENREKRRKEKPEGSPAICMREKFPPKQKQTEETN